MLLDGPAEAGWRTQSDEDDTQDCAVDLKSGALSYSGTPENVGPVVRGDTILCKLDGLPDLSIKII